MLSDIKSIFKHSSIYGFSTILQKGIGFIMIPVYTNFLTPSDYGTIELLDLTINIITMLVGLGLGAGIVRFYHYYESERDKKDLFSTSFYLIIIINLIVVAGLELFSRELSGLVLGDPLKFRYFQIILLAMGLQTIATVPENLLLAEKKSFIYSGISIVTLFSYLTFNILFLVVYQMGVMGILISMLITKVLNNAMLLIAVRKKLIWSFSYQKFKELAAFTLPLVPAAVFMFAMHYSDRFFLQKFGSLEELGIYSLGYKFGMIISVLISQPFFRIWNTKRFEIAKGEDGPQKISLFFTYFMFILVTAALGISIFIKEAILILTPPEYTEAHTLVAAIAIAYILYATSNFFTIGMVLKFKTKILSYIRIFTSLFNIGLNFILIRHYGIEGAVVSTIISFFLLALLSMVFSLKLYPIPIEYKRITILGVLFFVFLVVSNFIYLGIVYAIIVKILLFLAFPCILLLFDFFSQDELLHGRKILGSIFKRVVAVKGT